MATSVANPHARGTAAPATRGRAGVRLAPSSYRLFIMSAASSSAAASCSTKRAGSTLFVLRHGSAVLWSRRFMGRALLQAQPKELLAHALNELGPIIQNPTHAKLRIEVTGIRPSHTIPLNQIDCQLRVPQDCVLTSMWLTDGRQDRLHQFVLPAGRLPPIPSYAPLAVRRAQLVSIRELDVLPLGGTKYAPSYFLHPLVVSLQVELFTLSGVATPRMFELELPRMAVSSDSLFVSTPPDKCKRLLDRALQRHPMWIQLQINDSEEVYPAQLHLSLLQQEQIAIEQWLRNEGKEGRTVPRPIQRDAEEIVETEKPVSDHSKKLRLETSTSAAAAVHSGYDGPDGLATPISSSSLSSPPVPQLSPLHFSNKRKAEVALSTVNAEMQITADELARASAAVSASTTASASVSPHPRLLRQVSVESLPSLSRSSSFSLADRKAQFPSARSVERARVGRLAERAALNARVNQSKFRRLLWSRDRGCILTGIAAPRAVLEAAHLVAVADAASFVDHIQINGSRATLCHLMWQKNGMLLKSDFHALLDAKKKYMWFSVDKADVVRLHLDPSVSYISKHYPALTEASKPGGMELHVRGKNEPHSGRASFPKECIPFLKHKLHLEKLAATASAAARPPAGSQEPELRNAT